MAIKTNGNKLKTIFCLRIKDSECSLKVGVLYECTQVQVLNNSCYEYTSTEYIRLRVLQIVYLNTIITMSTSTGVYRPQP